MKYDFETVINRRPLGSSKWNRMWERNPNTPDGIVPFSAADMEFVPPPELLKGLREFIGRDVFGYTCATDAYYESVYSWFKRRLNYSIDKKWIVEAPGIVPAIDQMVPAFTEPEDAVAVLSPGYHPFYNAVKKSRRKLIEVPLTINHDTYDIDFQALEKELERPEVTLMIFCNPYNPAGRVWSKSELETLNNLCRGNSVFLISDEIHCDLILPGYQFCSFANLGEEVLNNCAICTAPSKTFNIAGFQVSNILVANPVYRKKMEQSKGYYSLNALAYKACEIVYNECEGWLDELLLVLNENKKIVKEFMNHNIPQVHVFDLQGTYLQWMDFRPLGMNKDELEKKLVDNYIYFSEGYGFSNYGEGFERMNLACPAKVVKEGLERVYQAVG